MKKRLIYFLCSVFAIFGLLFATQNSAYADPVTNPDTTIVTPGENTPDDENTPSETEETETEAEEGSSCYDQVGGIGWLVCPTTGALGWAIDSIYGIISSLIQVNPISTDTNSPIYLVWEYIRNITNVVFIIFLLVVIFSQVTGFGITNYGIKRTLPRIIIAAILVNLSFIVCALAVDVSNILGASLRSVFTNIQDVAIANGTINTVANFSIGETIAGIIGGGTLAAIGIGVAVASGSLWMLIPVVLSGIIAIIAALITIAARQALIMLLIMISPLAFVAYLLPNTEKWFKKWKDMLMQMLIFYPMFSVLFGASQLAGWVIITSATNILFVILGIAVQILPLFMSLSLLKMSGTILGSITAGVQKLAAPAQRGVTGWADSKRAASKAHHAASNRLPSAKLSNYLAYRKHLREDKTANDESTVKNRISERVAAKTEKPSIIPARVVDEATGKVSYERGARANRYARSAKTASYTATRASNAASSLQNTLGRYSTFYKTEADKALSDAHADAFLESGKQQFLTTNQAEADQDFMLKSYIKAYGGKEENTEDYRRLIADASGDLGHLGESAIMGQVFAKTVEMENRRRKEARVIFTKFGYNKRDFRDMMLGFKNNDDGYAVDETGREVEDRMYNLIPGKKRIAWDQYITDEQGNKIPYFHIRDDKGAIVQTVYGNDPGYIKELLIDDIAIGDPINDRYAFESGLAVFNGQQIGERDGTLRRWHSTIAHAMNDTRYKDHAAWMGPMTRVQIDRGYINSPGKLNIAILDSLDKTAKGSALLINDKPALEKLAYILSPENFSAAFPDEDIETYLNVNGASLKGLRWNESEEKWEKIDREKATLEDKKNFIKHNLMSSVLQKLANITGRPVTQNVAENQKPGTTEGLDSIADVLLGHFKSDPKIYEKQIDPRDIPQKVQGIIKRSKHQADTQNLLHDIGRMREDIEGIFFGSWDLDEFTTGITDYFRNTEELSGLANEVEEIVERNSISDRPGSREEALSNLTERPDENEIRSKIQQEIEDLMDRHFNH